MNLFKWFIRPEELFSIKNLCLLNITFELVNGIETDEKKNYWKYRSLKEIRENLLDKYYITSSTFIVVYTNDKLMMAARVAWLLYWLGHNYIRILIGKPDPILSSHHSPRPDMLLTLPPRPKLLITCEELVHEIHSPITKFIDVRTYQEFSGQSTGYTYVRRAGHIPGFEYDPTDGIYGRINGDITWKDLEEYLKQMTRYNRKKIERIVYMCGTGWRASLAAIFADELNLAEVITVLDSGWYEYSETFLC